MMLLARALYDNIAETPEELAFRRGDVLSVIERNTSGLDGWWLCSLKGRRGIVPGNRLKLLDKSAVSAETKAAAGPETGKSNVPPSLTAAQKTWHSQQRVVTPQRLGNMFVYDVPQRSQSSAKNSDYDVPPSRSGALPAAASKPQPRQTECDYDHPTSNRAVRQNGAPQKHSPGSLDTPHLLQIQMSSLDHYDVPGGSNRSSTTSVLSTGSSVSGLSSGSCPHSSVCESERSSLDLSTQDMYDVPPPARALASPSHGHRPASSGSKEPMYDTPKSVGKSAHSKSLDICNDYDVLKAGSGGDIYNTPRKDFSTYDTPRSAKPVSRNCSGDSGISLTVKPTGPQIYDNTSLGYIATGIQAFDTPKGKSFTEAEYDTPKPSRTACQMASPSLTRKMASSGSGNNVSVYDVPPRVTKDIAEPIGQTEEVKRDSSGSADSDIGPFPYDELRMELSAAMETLVSSQHCVNTSCCKLLGFVHPAWRSQEHLEPRVYEVKLASVAVCKAGELFLEFGQGALVNASKSDDKRLTKKLHGAVEALQESLTSFSQHLEKLNKEMWPLVFLVRQVGAAPDKEDDLDAIVRITKQIPEYVRSISGLIQGNSMHLFKRSSTPGSNGQPTTSTPKSKVKSPPPTKPKPRISITSPGCGVPMPKFTPKSPGGSTEGTLERALPPSKEVEADQPRAECQSNDTSDYDVPKPLAKSPAPPVQDIGSFAEDRKVLEEYDYVSLSKEPSVMKKISDGPQEKSDNIKPVEMREKEDKESKNENELKHKESTSGRSKVVQSLFPPPEVQTSGLSPSFKERLEKLQKEAEEPVKIYNEDYDVPQSRAVDRNSSRSQSINVAQLQTNDRLILQFYATQVDTHSNILINAIEAFLKCIEEKQSPKTFIAYSKFVILAAHKLVYIGDTLTRHLVNDNIRNDIMNHAYTLCELLKDTVTATKKAALEFPVVTSVQDMVDRVSEVSVAASGLKQIIIRFAS